MRCASCHSYIPEGLSSPVICPLCGQKAEAQPAATAPLKTEPSKTESGDPKFYVASGSEASFAPYFTIRTRLAFGLASLSPEPRDGSLSFGPEGFSIVCDDGKRWEKVLYRDLGQLRQVGNDLLVEIRGVESRLAVYHSWLPDWLPRARRKRASVLLELLGRVKNGLTSSEISLFQRKLQ